DWSLVAFASQSLTDKEQQYSQIEKETIAFHWGCRYFHLYMYGQVFVFTTNHKPLLFPFFEGPPQSHPPELKNGCCSNTTGRWSIDPAKPTGKTTCLDTQE
ncbi:hypothetical protein NDU88_009348, partial [Pleurodeles waltl]